MNIKCSVLPAALNITQQSTCHLPAGCATASALMIRQLLLVHVHATYLCLSICSKLLAGVRSWRCDEQHRLPAAAAAVAVAVLCLHHLPHAEGCWRQSWQVQQLTDQLASSSRQAAMLRSMR
jgi:hypothetical protein